MFKKILPVALNLVVLSVNAAVFTVEDIEVNGLQRIEKGVVYNAIPVQVGDDFDTEQSADIIKALYKSGDFTDVTVERDNNKIIIDLKERPSIAKITITGNKDIKTDDLQKALKDFGISEGLTYEKSILKKVETGLEQQYYNRGKYAIDIKSDVKHLDRNRVNLDIKISEGVPAKIKKINIVGNKTYSDHVLRGNFQQQTPSLFTWLTNADQYSKPKLGGDIEALRSFYLDRGFINVDVTSTQVAITPDKKDIYITINVKEGKQYTVSDVVLNGEFVVEKQKLADAVTIDKGEIYSQKKINQSITDITDILGEHGYAFSRVNVSHDLDEDNNSALLKFKIIPMSKVYVRRINFLGNFTTDAEVLRREMRQLEGTWASSKKIKQSRRNLMLLGFFQNVDINTTPVPGADDQIDIDVNVTEQHSGELKGGVGYSQLEGLLFNLGVRQNNFLGSGKLVDFAFNRSDSSSSYRIGYNNPYYTLNGISRGFDIYYQETNLDKANVASFIRDAYGASVSYGIPISEESRLSAGITLDQTKIKVKQSDSSVELNEFLSERNSFTNGKLSLVWSYVTLDKSIYPTSGLSHNLRVNGSVPGSDLQFYKLGINESLYIPIYNYEYILLLKGSLGYGNGYGKTKYLPLYEHYYAGGIGSVRGYVGNTLGPRDTPIGERQSAPLGGNLLTTATAEFIFPTPFVETHTIRSSVFVEGGSVFSTRGGVHNNDGARFSAGVTLQWLSPIGPFVISLSRPLNANKMDNTEPFQFSIGTVL